MSLTQDLKWSLEQRMHYNYSLSPASNWFVTLYCKLLHSVSSSSKHGRRDLDFYWTLYLWHKLQSSYPTSSAPPKEGTKGIGSFFWPLSHIEKDLEKAPKTHAYTHSSNIVQILRMMMMYCIKVGVNHGIFHVYHFWNFLIFKCTWVCSSSSSKNKNIFLNLSTNSINLKMSIYLSISKMCSSLFSRGNQACAYS